MDYKVMFHQGESVSLHTKAKVGRLRLEPDRLVITGHESVTIPFASLRSVELFRMHGTGRMLRVVHDAGTLFVSVVRFCLFGQFAVINFVATGKLRDNLQAAVPRRVPNTRNS